MSNEQALQQSALGGEHLTERGNPKTLPLPVAGPHRTRPKPLGRQHLKSVLESVLFAAAVPLALRQLTRLTQSTKDELQPLLAELQAEYATRGFRLVEIADGYQLRTAIENAPFVRELVGQKPTRLSRAQLEVLAIVAYRQPITRPEVDEVRGVDSGAALKLLGDRLLIRVLGRKEEPGRPLLYGTTSAFLEFFSLKSLRDLPSLREFSELSEESRMLFDKKLGTAEPLFDAPLGDAIPDRISFDNAALPNGTEANRGAQ